MASNESRLVGEHFRSDGSPKTRYDTEAEANEIIRRYGYIDKIAYPCRWPSCDGWHLGTRRRVTF
jgi:hypothetical protein